MQAWRHCRNSRSGGPCPQLAAPAADGDALAGLSPFLRDVFPPLPGTAAVYRLQSDAKNSTTDQSGAGGRMHA